MPEIFPTGQPQLSEAQNDHVNRIRTAPMKGSLVIVVGAGVSQSATSRDGKPLSQLTWSGLILHGLNFLDSEGFLESDEKVDVDYYRSVLQRAPTSSNYSTNLLFAATYMKHKLEEHKKYVTWLELVFSNLRKHLHQTDILRELGGLQKMGAKLVTTNYDDLLDRFCNLRPIGPSNIYDLQMFTRAKQTQSALQAFFIAHTVLFVGSGGGMQDPNFGKLLKWATTHLSNIRNSHYILTRNEENIRYQPLNNVRYGPTYEHLVPFLHTLREPYNLFGVWKSVSIFDKNTGTVEESENDKPRAITTVSNGTPTGVLVYVLYDDRVQKFHMDYAGDPFGERPANFQAQWGSRGTGNGQFVEPLFIWASMCGEIYVTDTNNHRVQVFDAGGTYLRQWGTNGTGKGQFAKPWGNCGLDPTLDRRIPCNPKDVEIFVCDKDNKRVQIFNGLGEFKSMFSDKDWFEVSCIQVLRQGGIGRRVYVGDRHLMRV